MSDIIKKLQNQFIKEGYNIQKGNEIENNSKLRTGIFALDYVLDGGISLVEGGHRIEFYGAESSGKTTFALYLIKCYQDAGKTCLFVDGERSYDKEWAEILGIDNSKILVAKPESLEDAGHLIEQAVIEGIDLIVVDSIVSFEPKQEVERDLEEPTMALQARVNAVLTRKLYTALESKSTTFVFINQLREKVGVCFTGDTRIKLDSNRKTERIDKLYNDLLIYPILTTTYNEKKNKVERRIIEKISKRKYSGKIYDITINSSSGGGLTRFRGTEEHLILTNKGWKKLKDLKKSDLIKIQYDDYFPSNNEELESKLLACLIGDGNTRIFKHSASFRLCHSKKQEDYLEIKSNVLNLKGTFQRYSNKIYFTSESSYNIKKIVTQMYPDYQTYKKIGKKKLTKNLLNKIFETDFVYLYLDDGTLIQDKRNKNIKISICVKGLDKQSIKNLINRFKEFGYNPSYCLSGSIIFNKTDSMIFLNKIKSYVPNCMQYKLPKGYRDFYLEERPYEIQIIKETRFEKIIKINKKAVQNINVYNMAIPDTHTYIVGGKQGAIVHNCYGNPYTTGGGRALKHFYNTRIEFKLTDPIDIGSGDNKERVGYAIKLKCVKNKKGKPHRNATVDFYFNGNLDNKKSLFFNAVKFSIIKRSGAWFEYKDIKTQGKDKLIAQLTDKDWKEIEDEIWRNIK